MRNEVGDKCFADSITVYNNGKKVSGKNITLFAEVDGMHFDSSEYNTKQDWLNDIVKRVYDCAMGNLN